MTKKLPRETPLTITYNLHVLVRFNSAMAESTNPPPSSSSSTTKATASHGLIFRFSLLLAVLIIAALISRFDDLDPAALPEEGLSRVPMSVRKHYGGILGETERIGKGKMSGPEDLAYDGESGLIYASCGDGWIKRVTVTESPAEATVENWVYVGGRPLGLALGPDKEVIVAESFKGLIKVTKEGHVELLTNEAEGLKLKMVDGVDIANDGMIYFTDATYKYNFHQYMLDVLEGRPYGRLLSFDPSTNTTQVLLADLYFANGVSLSPEQDFVVFCETTMRRCRKYYVKGEKKGSVEKFVDNLPGYPDNIRYDGRLYWIGTSTENTLFYDSLMRYPLMRKIIAVIGKFVELPFMGKDGGMMAVNSDGEVIASYTDPALILVTGGLKIGNHLYYGSLIASYIGRLNLNQEGASAA